ncbi:MAG: purine-nucleoside phosphorylase [Bacilli bacterium]
MPTPHINVDSKDIIAKTVLMPGDPLRAKYVADNFLDDVVLFSTVRNMYGYTGYFKGKKVSVMGSGMGMPSIGIYSYELFDFYDVDRIIRIGSAGAYTDKLNVFDVVLAKSAWSESSFAKTMTGDKSEYIEGSSQLNKLLSDTAKELKINVVEDIVHSSDVFYRKNFKDFETIYKEKGCVCVEMESFALFTNANFLNKEAACILTISDSLVKSEVTTSEEREKKLNEMITIALETAIK